ncbi:hypothetical protein LG409_01605 [Halomonas sp. NyZ770]|nr:hypothetical protein LG409_01605 [Halomonas sp. NyZ770]
MSRSSAQGRTPDHSRRYLPRHRQGVVTTSSPVFALATVHMDEDVAYRLTRTFWEQQAALMETSPWWGSVTAELLAHLPVDLHPGALRYYEEAEVELPEALR